MKFDKLKNYKKALILGTGGGNDIVSATLIADYLHNQGIECDVAGILSPGALHEFEGETEKIVNEIVNVKRYLTNKEKTEISFIDGVLPFYAKKHGYNVDNFYDISLRYGTEYLVDGVNKLISDNKYDVFIEVDVGGDILGRAKDDTLLSPLMDFSSLYLLDKVEVDSYLIEFGFGTDGELRPDGIVEIIAEMMEEDVLLEIKDISLDDKEVDKWSDLVDVISPIRKGHTTTMTLETLQPIVKIMGDINTIYYSSWRIGDKIHKNYYDVTIPSETFGKVFLLDGKKLPNLRKETCFEYKTPIEQLRKLKLINPNWKTELDLCFIDGIYFLTPSLQVPEDMRKDIIEDGLKLLGFSTSRIIIQKFDEKYIKGYTYHEHNGFYLVTGGNDGY